MDTEDLVIANKFMFSRHKVSSRAQSEKVFFFPLTRVGNDQQKTWAERRKIELGNPGPGPSLR